MSHHSHVNCCVCSHGTSLEIACARCIHEEMDDLKKKVEELDRKVALLSQDEGEG